MNLKISDVDILSAQTNNDRHNTESGNIKLNL